MKLAADFRQIARNALKGRWGIAVIAGLIASLLGAVASEGPELSFNFSDNGANVDLKVAGQQIFSTAEGWLPELGAVLLGGAIFLAVVTLVMTVVLFVLGSIVEVGYCRFNLDLVDRQKAPELGSLFGYFPHWKNAAIARLMKTVYIFLWSLLFIIPGVMKAFSYAMVGYILAENPNMMPEEALRRSKEMMDGNRWRLFCLYVSFIGWDLLSTLTLGIGGLWVNPYKQAAKTAFYREVSGTQYRSAASGNGYYIDTEGEVL